MKRVFKEEPSEWRKFVLSCLAGQSLVLFLAMRKSYLPVWVALALAGLILLGGLLATLFPEKCRGIYRVGMGIGFAVGEVMIALLLGVVFLAMVFPMGMIMRLFGHDPLHLKRSPGIATHWKRAAPLSELDRMF